MRPSEDSKLSTEVSKTSQLFMETELPINISKPLPMAFDAAAHVAKGQL
jgi:hypothetical protein